MLISFFSNFLNHHQLPLCQELIRIVGEDNFHFIATDSITEERLSLGYENMNENYPFVVKEYEGGDAIVKCEQLAIESDIAIFTQTTFHYCEKRLKENKVSFLYIERQFKRGLVSLAHPRVFKRYMGYLKCRNKPLYILCAGAFVANDMVLFGFPREKCFKWGYFPAVNSIDINKIIKSRDKHVFRMMWCARFINWKRPEWAIKLARDLKKKGYIIILDMYGNGVLTERIEKMVKGYNLEQVVRIHGSVSNQDVLRELQSHDALLVTSNKREGWGAVINEAMANGCTLIASDQIGAVPYLIENGYNGVVYKTNDYKSLLRATEDLIKNRSTCCMYSERSYQIIHTIWSASNAVKNLLSLNDYLIGRGKSVVEKGPCSYA